MPVVHKEEVHWLIQPVKSYNHQASPIAIARKKDSSPRFCVDYRKLNAVTNKDAYPLPSIDDTLDTLSGSQWFSTLDLLSGYWQVEVAEGDRLFPCRVDCSSLRLCLLGCAMTLPHFKR